MFIAPPLTFTLPCIQALEDDNTRAKNYIASMHMQGFDDITAPAPTASSTLPFGEPNTPTYPPGSWQMSAKAPPPPPPPVLEPVTTLVLTGDIYTQPEYDPGDVVILYGVPSPVLVKTEQDKQRMWLRFATEEGAQAALGQLSAKKAQGELSEQFKAKMAARNYHQPAQEAGEQAREKKKLYIGPIKDRSHVDDPSWIPHVFPTLSAYQTLSHVSHCRKRATSAFRSDHFISFHWSCAHPS